MAGAASAAAATRELMKMVVQSWGAVSNYNRVVARCELVDKASARGKCAVKVTLGEPECNHANTMHGGFGAMLVDNVTSLTLLTEDEASVLGIGGVSVDMHITYLQAAKLGQEVTMEASLVKQGRNLAFTEARLYDAERNLLLTGSHTKFIGGPLIALPSVSPS